MTLQSDHNGAWPGTADRPHWDWEKSLSQPANHDLNLTTGW